MKAVRETDADVEIVDGSARATLTMPRSFPANAIVNDAVCVEVSGDGIDTYVIVDAFPTRYIPGEEKQPAGARHRPRDLRRRRVAVERSPLEGLDLDAMQGPRDAGGRSLLACPARGSRPANGQR
jgi:hypothetical protein